MKEKLSPNKTNGFDTKWIVLTVVIAAIFIGAAVWLILSRENSAFPEIPQTEEEATVFFRYGDKELTRDLYLYLWNGYLALAEPKPQTEKEKSDFFTETHAKIRKDMARLLSTEEFAAELGISPDSKESKQLFTNLLQYTKDGGTFDGVTYYGYGTEEAYKEALAASSMTDFVYRLYLRNTVAEYLAASAFTPKASEYTAVDADSVYGFFGGEDAARITYAYISYDSYLGNVEDAADAAERIYAALLTKKDDLASYIRYEIQASITVSGEEQKNIEKGLYLTRYHAVQNPLSDFVFSMNVDDIRLFEASEGIYILRRLPLGNAREVGVSYENLFATYISNAFYKEIAERAALAEAALTETSDAPTGYFD